MELLEGKTAIITGASRGIGRAIAIKFAEHGAFVGINYFKSKDGAEETLGEVKKSSDGMLLEADVSDYGEVKDMVNKFLERTGSIDIVVNNAGIYRRSSFLNISSRQWDEVMNVNLKGCYNVCMHSIPHMKKGGRIIFISSQLAFKGSSHGADYAASKAGILGLMRSLALELADKKINVNAVAPGTIDTDIIASYTEKQRREREMQIPLKRIGSPEDIANACLFLASSLSGYITGETIHVNGGLYIH
jgi:3-oxoacyl-[acyl-carrier protein] reductase